MAEVERQFARQLAQQGIDIVHALDARWYNAHLEEHGLQPHLKPLPDFGRRDGALAFLLANSRALWPCFLDWLKAQPEPEHIADPLDRYTESVIRGAVAKLTTTQGDEGSAPAHDIFWSWEKGDRLVSMQRVAVASALCYHDGETQLAIHPTYGAWVAFRAVVVINARPPSAPAPDKLACLLTDKEKAAAREAMAAALRASDEANLCTQLHGAKGMEKDVRLAWAALRDCVGVGKDERYSEEQLEYHYTKDKAVLLRALTAR